MPSPSRIRHPHRRSLRQLGVSDATFDAWKKKYAHLGVSEPRRRRPTPLVSRKHSHHPHWMSRGIMRAHYVSMGPRSSGDVRTEPQPRATKPHDVGCEI